MSISPADLRGCGSFPPVMRNLMLVSTTWLAMVSSVQAASRMACDAAALRAARATQVPLVILKAITRVETGRQGVDGLEPWPWAVNMAGKGHWFDSAEAAHGFVYDAFLDGARDFDVGCFQINYRWHGHHFPTVEAMFDPDANAVYAARFLSALHEETGSWMSAVRAYHSRTDGLADLYEARFQRVLSTLDPSPGEGNGSFSLTRGHDAPTAAPGSPGSLVRLSESAGRRLGFFRPTGAD